MDTRQLTTGLDRLFREEDARIVFWNDSEREFQSVVPLLELDGVTTIMLDQVGSLEVKIRLEEEDPDGKYLLYSPAEEPDYESDWLLDIRLYSRSFRADRASILLDELGLKNHHLRQHLADRRRFFDNKERLQKLKQLVAENDLADDLDLKMIAVVARAEQPEFFNIVRTLFHAYSEAAEEADLDSLPAIWQSLERFDLARPFWEIAHAKFGYVDEAPSLKNLLIRLAVTDYAVSLEADVPAALASLVLPPRGRPNAVVCLAQWRDSSSRGMSYDRLLAEVASLIHLNDHLHGIETERLLDVMTFLDVEKAIASGLRERVQTTADTINADDVRAIVRRRQAGHWASLTMTGAPEVPRQALHAVYHALEAAAELFSLRNRHPRGFEYSTAADMYRAYEAELYAFDQLYRHFCEYADEAEARGWNLLKPLRGAIEDCYANWYQPNLALSWGKFLESSGPAPLLDTWRIAGIRNQYQFFDREVAPWLRKADNRKVFVIISDAFRFEAARELASELNGKYRFEAKLSSQLGVLPSYTALGMASLLPHKTLRFTEGGDVQLDGRPVASLEQRHEILESVEGMACKANDLLGMKKEQGREFVNGKRVVYIYHNVVDAVGDTASTEEKTFDAVRTAIEELSSLVVYVINNLNGGHVVITADHGFLFTESSPSETDKSKLDHKPAGTVKAKKRYLVGRGLPNHDAVWHGKTAITARAEGDMEFWIPKGVNRFHFTGGARFVHGGAMLQEIVVPVLTVKHVRGKSARETKTKTVAVHVLGATHKITTNRHRFELIQMEPVGERVKSATLKIAILEGDEPVTNVETVKFDSSSDKLDERKRWVSLVLQDREYDKKTDYRLVLRDAETGIEEQSVPVVVDRAFHDDF